MHWDRKLATGCALAWLVLGTLDGCGQKGPLYLPDEARGIVTRPSSAGPGETRESPNSPQTPDSSPQPASPAPEVSAPAEDKDKKHPAPSPPQP